MRPPFGTPAALLRLIPSLIVVLSMFPMTAMADDPPPTPEWDSPALSPNGAQLIFTGSVFGITTIWIADSGGANARTLVNWQGSSQKEADWAPNGLDIVLSSDRGSDNFNIWLISATGTNARQLTANSGNNTQPRYSPDGNWIAFLSNRTGKRELWYMRTDGSQQKAIGLQSLYVSSPSWSPDGQFIVYSGCTRPPSGSALSEGTCNLYVTKLDSSVTTKITSGSFMDWDPDWASGGILFSSSRTGGQDIYLVNPNGSGLTRITPTGPGISMQPRWNRGSTTAFIFTRVSKQQNVWASTTGGSEVQLTRFAATAIVGDLNLTGIVDCADLAIVKTSLGKRNGQLGYDVRADLDSNGVVDVRDYSAFTQKLPAGTVCQ